MKNLIVVLLLVVSTTTFARIGETVQECAKRYGNPVFESQNAGNPKNQIKGYIKSDFNILITFIDGKAYSLSYTKPKRDDAAYKEKKNSKGWMNTSFTQYAYLNQTLSSKTINALLKANSQGEQWRILFTRDAWVRKTNTMAEYVPNVKTFIVADVATLLTLKKHREDKLEGF